MGGIEIHVTVAELTNHVSHNLKQLLLRHRLRDARRIALTNFVPVKTIFLRFEREETVASIECLPKGLEVTRPGVGGHVFRDAGDECQACDE